MRRLIAFPCEGDTLAGTLDEADGATGLLIVSGGSEIRIGAHRGMALLAQRIAAAGHPVLRYDRRGIGDSTGHDRGFDDSAADIAAAVAAFRREAPHVARIVAFGNCDAASALALHGHGVDAYALANPWVIEPTDELPPAGAIRQRYAERLRDPRAWLRLVSGGVDLRKLARGLRKASRAPDAPAGLAARIAAVLDAKDAPVAILLARRDNTAIAFAQVWATESFAPLHQRLTLDQCETDSHSFHRPADKAWLEERLLAALGQC
jgi:exosortase A-associated hydrolase 1